MMKNNNSSFKLTLIIILCIIVLITLFVDLILIGVIKLPISNSEKNNPEKVKVVDKDSGYSDSETEEEEETEPEEADGTFINITKDEVYLDHLGDEKNLEISTDILDQSKITWSSENKDIAIVDSEGVVAEVSYGTTYVTASCGDLSDRCKIICESEGSSPDYGYQQEDPGKEDYGSYILPQSNSRYLTESDLAGLSKRELKLARNEIYARKGRKFKDKDIQNYFNSQGWYYGYIDADDFNEATLTDIEKYNAEYIRSYEHKMGYI